VSSAPLEVRDLGRQSYHDALELQRSLRLDRVSGALAHDVLLLLEHDPVFTLGRATKGTSLPISVETLRARGAEVVEVERGGDVTWHGPGQIVGYPIIHLSDHREDLHWYLRTLEQVVIDALASMGLDGARDPGRTGVWVGGRKIASIGVHVKRWVTLHGFALNVDPDLSWFDMIVPCGLDGVSMTSVAREIDGRSAPAVSRQARDAIVCAFQAHFGSSAKV